MGQGNKVSKLWITLQEGVKNGESGSKTPQPVVSLWEGGSYDLRDFPIAQRAQELEWFIEIPLAPPPSGSVVPTSELSAPPSP